MAETNPNGSKCLLCEYSKHVDRCHIIPRSICRFTDGLINHAKFDTDNIVLLCKNHHWELDHNLISDDDFCIIVSQHILKREQFKRVYSALIAGKLTVDEGRKYSIKRIKEIHKANRWIRFQRARLDRLGYLQDGVPEYHTEFYKKYAGSSVGQR